MKIVSWNVNGIRACVKKGFLDFLSTESPDICCLQETKAHPSQLPDHVLNPQGYHGIWHSAERPGYSGVSILTKPKPSLALEGFGIPIYDCEGRVIVTEYDQFMLLNIYFPNGQKNEERLQYKLDFYQDLFEYCSDLLAQGKNLIICGDYNTAHHPIDLANPKANEKYSGFLPIERAWMDKLINEMGYVDTFRDFCKDPDHYTWWSYRFGARKRNIGWRIDYFLVNKAFMPHVKSSYILKDVMGSDHCPIVLEIDAH